MILISFESYVSNMVRAPASQITGFCPGRTEKYLKNSMNKMKKTWRKYHVINLEYMICNVTWTTKDEREPLVIQSPVAKGVMDTVKKSLIGNSLNAQSVPRYVVEWLGFTKRPSKKVLDDLQLKSEVSFAVPPGKTHGSFHRIYCCECERPRMREIWNMHGDKLPAEMSVINLINNWDKLGLSWNWNDVLGCILPNVSSHYVVFNARNFLTDPHEHDTKCHISSSTEANKKHMKQTVELSFLGEKRTASSASSSITSGFSSSTSSTTPANLEPAKKKPLVSPKGSNIPKNLRQSKITDIDPVVKHGDVPQTPMECWQCLLMCAHRSQQKQ